MIYLQIGLGLLLFFFLTTIVMYFKNRKLKQEIRVLSETLAGKETTIDDLEASGETVKETIDHFSTHDEVMELLEAGESRESISEKLGIPANKIELIIKFDKIKKEKHV